MPNEGFENYFIKTAMQDIAFRLDRYGASLKVEVLMYLTACRPTDFFFDRPFLLYMQKRGASQPYFAMWIENAELLNKWEE